MTIIMFVSQCTNLPFNHFFVLLCNQSNIFIYKKSKYYNEDENISEKYILYFTLKHNYYSIIFNTLEC